MTTKIKEVNSLLMLEYILGKLMDTLEEPEKSLDKTLAKFREQSFSAKAFINQKERFLKKIKTSL